MLKNIYVLGVLGVLGVVIGSIVNSFDHNGLSTAVFVGMIIGYIYSVQHEVQISFKKSLVIILMYIGLVMLISVFLGEPITQVSTQGLIFGAFFVSLLYAVVLYIGLLTGSWLCMRRIIEKKKIASGS